MSMEKNFLKEKKQLEQEKEKLIKEKELIALRAEVESMRRGTQEPSGLAKVGKMWLKGAKKLGSGLVNVGGKLANSDINSALGTKRK